MRWVIGCAGLQHGEGEVGLEYLDIICGGYVGVLLLDFAAVYLESPSVTWTGERNAHFPYGEKMQPITW